MQANFPIHFSPSKTTDNGSNRQNYTLEIGTKSRTSIITTYNIRFKKNSRIATQFQGPTSWNWNLFQSISFFHFFHRISVGKKSNKTSFFVFMLLRTLTPPYGKKSRNISRFWRVLVCDWKFKNINLPRNQKASKFFRSEWWADKDDTYGNQINL